MERMERVLLSRRQKGISSSSRLSLDRQWRSSSMASVSYIWMTADVVVQEGISKQEQLLYSCPFRLILEGPEGLPGG